MNATCRGICRRTSTPFTCGGAAGTYGEANVKDGTARVLFIQFRGDWQAIDDLRAKWKSR